MYTTKSRVLSQILSRSTVGPKRRKSGNGRTHSPYFLSLQPEHAQSVSSTQKLHYTILSRVTFFDLITDMEIRNFVVAVGLAICLHSVQSGEPEVCVVPPYADIRLSPPSFIPPEELDGLLLEGRCFLACLDRDPNLLVRIIFIADLPSDHTLKYLTFWDMKM